MQNEHLDHVFGALSDPTRRGMLARLSQGEATVSTLAEPYAMSQPAISKHLRVLEAAGLITRENRGRERIVRVRATTLETALDWIERHTQMWRGQFDAVEDYLQQKAKKDDGT